MPPQALTQVDLWPVEEPAGLDVSEGSFHDRRRRVQPAKLDRELARLCDVRLRDHESVGNDSLLHRLRLSEAMHRIDGRDHVLEGVEMLDMRVGDEAADHGAGSASPVVSITTRSKGGTCARSRLRARSRSESMRSSRTAQQIHTAREHDCALVDLPDEVVIERNLTELSSRSAAVLLASGWARSRAMSVVFPLPRKPVTRATGSR